MLEPAEISERAQRVQKVAARIAAVAKLRNSLKECTAREIEKVVDMSRLTWQDAFDDFGVKVVLSNAIAAGLDIEIEKLRKELADAATAVSESIVAIPVSA